MKKIPHKLLILTAILLAIVIFFVGLDIVNAKNIILGMEVAGIPLGGMSKDDALKKLEFSYQQLIADDFSLIYKNFIWTVNLKSMGIEIDVQKTIDRVLTLGREKNKFFSNRWWQARVFFGYSLEPAWNIDEEKLEKFLRENLASIHQPAKNSILVYDKKTRNFVVAPSKSGTVIEKTKFEENLKKMIKNFQTSDIKLSVIDDYPQVIESETNKAKQQALELLKNAPITIATENLKNMDIITKDKMLSLMDFVPVIDESNPENKILGVEFNKEKINDYLVSLSPLINRDPVNAQLTVQDGRVTAFALSQDGIKLKIEENTTILAQGLFNPPINKEILLETEKTQPKISTADIDNLGITALLAKGVSNFGGSPTNRIHNIKIGAAKFNGVLLKPNEEFSFNGVLGEVGPEQGYQPELVILKDKTTPEYGGGLCQVSTTAFRAAIFAGLEITQRYAHAFPVKYYNPQGFDATIYPPSPDLKFINNTLNYILVQTKIKGTELTFEFYGTDDGRKVTVQGPEQYDIQTDGSMKAKLMQKVYDKNNNIIIDKTFYSNYKSPNLYPVEQRNPLE